MEGQGWALQDQGKVTEGLGQRRQVRKALNRASSQSRGASTDPGPTCPHQERQSRSAPAKLVPEDSGNEHGLQGARTRDETCSVKKWKGSRETRTCVASSKDRVLIAALCKERKAGSDLKVLLLQL